MMSDPNLFQIEDTWLTPYGLRAVCMIIRKMHRCGYVEVPPKHPLHGCGYSEEVDMLKVNPRLVGGALAGDDTMIRVEGLIEVHGGLTFSGSGEDYLPEGDGWWFGFDCAHAGDGLMNNPIMSHMGKEDTVKTLDYVREECTRLAGQLAAIAAGPP